MLGLYRTDFKLLSAAVGCEVRGSALSEEKVLDVPQHASEPFLPLSLPTNSSLIFATKPALKPVLATVHALIRGYLPNGAAGDVGSVLCGNAWDDWAEVSRGHSSCHRAMKDRTLEPVGEFDLASTGAFSAWLHPAASTIEPTSPASPSLPGEKIARSRADDGILRQAPRTGNCAPCARRTSYIPMSDPMTRHGLAFLQRSDLSGSCLSAYGSTRSRNRPVRTRTPGGVGAGG